MIDKIEKKILDDAQKQKSQIIGEAEKERSARLSQAKAELEKEKKKLLARGRREAGREKQRLVSEANLDVKRNLLRAKEELIDTVLRKAGEALEKHTLEKAYAKTLERLAGECRKELGAGARIYVRAKDTSLLKGSKGREMNPGVMGESKDSSLYLDNTFEMRLKRNRESIRKEIGGILFK